MNEPDRPIGTETRGGRPCRDLLAPTPEGGPRRDRARVGPAVETPRATTTRAARGPRLHVEPDHLLHDPGAHPRRRRAGPRTIVRPTPAASCCWWARPRTPRTTSTPASRRTATWWAITTGLLRARHDQRLGRRGPEAPLDGAGAPDRRPPDLALVGQPRGPTARRPALHRARGDGRQVLYSSLTWTDPVRGTIATAHGRPGPIPTRRPT